MTTDHPIIPVMRIGPPTLRRARRAALVWPLAVALLVGLTATGSSAQRTVPAASRAAAAPVAPTSPSPEFETQFVSRINSLRASKGLSQLQVSGQLQGVARNWTEQMVRDGQISHNPNLGSQVSGNWTKLGENVGVGYDVDGLMQAFINSPAHYRNLVDPEWNYVGVGVTMAGDGRMYTTHNFMAMPSSTPKPPPPPPSTTATTRPRSSGGSTPPPPPAATTTTTAPPPPQPHPNEARVSAVLDPLRSLERG